MVVYDHSIRITDMSHIAQLYEDGVISRTTLWRSKKRGWCSPYWQRKERTSETSKEEMYMLIESLYDSIIKKAIHIYSIYGKNENWSVCDDMAHDAIIHLVEKREVKHPLIVAGSYMKHYLLAGKYK